MIFTNEMCLKFGRWVQIRLVTKNMAEKFRLKIHNGGFFAKNRHISIKIEKLATEIMSKLEFKWWDIDSNT